MKNKTVYEVVYRSCIVAVFNSILLYNGIRRTPEIAIYFYIIKVI